MTLDKMFNYPEIHIDLTKYKKDKVFVRIDSRVYQIDMERLVKDYGKLVSIVFDNKTEDGEVVNSEESLIPIVEAAAKSLNENPNEAKFQYFMEWLRMYSDAYKANHGHRPKLSIDQILLSLSLEVIDKYRDRLPLGENVIPFDEEE